MRPTIEQKFLANFRRGPVDKCWPWRGAVDSRGYGQVRDIRDRAAKGEDLSEIAEDFGVKRQTIWAAVNRYSWKHIS